VVLDEHIFIEGAIVEGHSVGARRSPSRWSVEAVEANASSSALDQRGPKMSVPDANALRTALRISSMVRSFGHVLIMFNQRESIFFGTRVDINFP
jgi:hypothetical protein